MWKNPGRETVIRPGGRVVMQRTANPRTPVQFRPRPPDRKAPPRRGFFVGRVPIGAEAVPQRRSVSVGADPVRDCFLQERTIADRVRSCKSPRRWLVADRVRSYSGGRIA